MSDDVTVKDIELLERIGIHNPHFQRLATEAVPCGIKSVSAAWGDKTSMQVNQPRVVMLVEWKGFLRGLATAERATKEGER